MKKWLLALLSVAFVSGGLVFAAMLQTGLYAYAIYMLLGVIYYLIIKCFGRETIFVLIIPLLIFATVLSGPVFMLDFYNGNGLNPLKIHPFNLAWLIAFTLLTIEDVWKKRIQIDKIVILSAAVVVVFLGITVLTRGLSGISMAIHNYLGPITLFIAFYYSKEIDARKVNKAILILLWISVIIGCLGIYEYAVEGNVLQQIYSQETPDWLDSTLKEGYRIKTIIGHPLDNAIFFIFAMMLTHMRIKNLPWKYALLLLFSVDILLTGSRSTFLLAILVLLYNRQLFNSKPKLSSQHAVTLAVAGLLVVFTLMTPLGTTLLNRFEMADDSTNARVQLMDYFVSHLFTLHMMGLGGATENIILKDSMNNQVFMENPWIILFFDVGYFILLFMYLLFCIYRKVDYKFLLLVFILVLSGSNSFGVKSNASFFLFFLMSYGNVLNREQAASQRVATQTPEVNVM